MWTDYMTIFTLYVLAAAYIVSMSVLARGFQLTVQTQG